jgi:hypothetical protein
MKEWSSPDPEAVASCWCTTGSSHRFRQQTHARKDLLALVAAGPLSNSVANDRHGSVEHASHQNLLNSAVNCLDVFLPAR